MENTGRYEIQAKRMGRWVTVGHRPSLDAARGVMARKGGECGWARVLDAAGAVVWEVRL